MIVFFKYLTYFTTYIINIIKFLLESTLYHPWIVLQNIAHYNEDDIFAHEIPFNTEENVNDLFFVYNFCSPS